MVHSSRGEPALPPSDVAAAQPQGARPRLWRRTRARARLLRQRVRAVRGDVETFAGEEGARLADACVILDPPRTGLSPVVSAALAAASPRRVIYVSCDPATLARDLQVLTAAGLRVDALTVFDLFPLTAHVETVVTLTNEA